jgi:hypothetical protein
VRGEEHVPHSVIRTGDNGSMEPVTPDPDLARIEELLSSLETLDPAELTQPAAEIAEMLGRMLEGSGEERI